MRKILITGDWHLRFKRPQSRKDESYFQTQFGKVKQILDLALRHSATIVQPGDFFDSPEAPYFLVQHYLRELEGAHNILCVRGQHDLRYHSRNYQNIPLAVFEAAGVVEVLDPEPYESGNVLIFGASWGEEIPDCTQWPDYKDYFKIIVMHKMVVQEKIWEGQEDFTYAKHLSRKYPYDLFICGDNHKSFLVFDNKRPRVFNCGSLMRSSIDQIHHRPVVYIYDIETGEFEEHFLDVAPPEEVFNMEAVELKKERNEKLEAFIAGLEEEKDVGLDFAHNLNIVMKQVKEKGVKDIVDEIMAKEDPA